MLGSLVHQDHQVKYNRFCCDFSSFGCLLILSTMQGLILVGVIIQKWIIPICEVTPLYACQALKVGLVSPETLDVQGLTVPKERGETSVSEDSLVQKVNLSGGMSLIRFSVRMGRFREDICCCQSQEKKDSQHISWYNVFHLLSVLVNIDDVDETENRLKFLQITSSWGVFQLKLYKLYFNLYDNTVHLFPINGKQSKMKLPFNLCDLLQQSLTHVTGWSRIQELC